MHLAQVVRCLTICLAVAPIAAAPVAAQRSTDARTGYDATVQKFADAFKRGDVAALTALYTEDATFIEPDGSVIKGRAGLAKYLRDMLTTAIMKDFTIHTSEFHSEGPIAYAIGTEHVVVTDRKTHKDVTEDVQFLVVFRQDPDKQWRLQYAMEAPMPPKANGTKQM